MLWLKQSTAATLRIGPFLDDTDGKTAKTALTISQADVRLSKNGGAAAQKNDATACTHDENGYYSCPVNTTDTNTLGRLRVEVIESGALPVWHEYLVVPANVYDSLVSGSDYLQADSVQIEGADATDTINAQCDTALSDYDAPTKAELDSGLAGLNDLSAAEVNAEVDTALSEYDAVVPADLPTNFGDLAITETTGLVTAGTVSDKTGYALTSAYDAAKTAAAAGAQMDLVDAPNATAVTALQSGMAPANEYDVEMARIDDTVSSRAQAGDAMTLNDLGVGKVWDALLTGLITPDSIGKLIADYLDAAVSSRVSAADVEPAPPNMSLLDITALGEVNVGAVAGTAVTGPDDLKANVSNLDVAVSSRSSHSAADAAALLNNLSSADAQAAAESALAAYDAATGTDVTAATSGLSTFDPATAEVDVGAVKGAAVTGVDDFKATGFSTHSAADAASAVWGAGSRTLTSFGTLVADIATAVWSAAARTLTAFGFTAGANVTQVGGQSVSGPDDLKADVSALALEATVGALNNLSSAEAEAAATAALNAYDGPTKAELDAAEGNIRGTDGDTLKTLSDEIAEGGGGGGDATAENQQAIIDSLTEAKGAGFNTLTDSLEALRNRGGDATADNQAAILAILAAMQGEEWAEDDDSLAALSEKLAALPAEALAAIEAAHGEGPYDQAAMLAAKLVTSQFVAEGDELLFFRDTSPQAVSLVVSPPVDLSGWELWLTIKPATPEVREEEDNASAICSVAGTGYNTGLMAFSVTAANVAGMTLDRAYDYSIEGKLGEQYRCFRRGTAKLTYNVRRNV